MYTYISKAIKAKQEIILSLADGSKISGLPSWGVDRSRVKIKSPERIIWVPVDEIKHVTILQSIQKRI